MRSIVKFTCRILVILVLSAVALPGRADDWHWSGVDRVVAIADIHGAYDAFVAILKRAGLVDDELDWAGNSTHLVIVGDVLDRGAESRRALELIMKLEQQAAPAGGYVHMVLGNHEIMNLTGDLGYVSVAEYASYAAEEDPAVRDAAYARYVAAHPGAGAAEMQAAFDKQYPRGFFGHRRLFAPDGRFGSWLVDKPVLLQIDDTLFVHGGIAAGRLNQQGDAINRDYAVLLRDYLQSWQTLAGDDVLPPESDFYDHEKILAAFTAQPPAGTTAGVIDTAKRLAQLNTSPLLGIDSVFWYRGNVLCNAVMAESELDAVLRHFNASRLVIGHTPTQSHEVLGRFNGKLVRADTGMLSSHYNGRPSAVQIEHGRVSALYTTETTPQEPVPQSRVVGARPLSMDDDQIAVLLNGAVFRDAGKQANGSRLLQFDQSGKTFNAVFTPAGDKRRNRVFIPEVAAYRLDRMLGLELVPVAVARTFDGEPGAVSLVQDSLVSERTRKEQKSGGTAWCPLATQYNLMYAFDILVYNEGRTPDDMRYSGSDWSLVLTGNHKTFDNRGSRPRYLANAPVVLPELLAVRLRELNESSLAEQLGDVLDSKRRAGLLQRRDLLLSPSK